MGRGQRCRSAVHIAVEKEGKATVTFIYVRLRGVKIKPTLPACEGGCKENRQGQRTATERRRGPSLSRPLPSSQTVCSTGGSGNGCVFPAASPSGPFIRVPLVSPPRRLSSRSSLPSPSLPSGGPPCLPWFPLPRPSSHWPCSSFQKYVFHW